MEEVEIEVNNKKIKVVTKLPKEYIEDNNLEVFLDNTIDLKNVINEINSNDSDDKMLGLKDDYE